MHRYAESITIGDLLVRAAERFGDREALVLADERLGFTDLRERAEEVAAGLAGLGVERGDRVGLLMPNCVDFVHTFFGASLLGAVVVPLNARFKRTEVAHVLRDAGIRVLFTSDVAAEHTDHVGLLGDCLPSLGRAPHDATSLELPEAPDLRCVVLLGRASPAGYLSRTAFQALAAGVPRSLLDRVRAGTRIRDVAVLPYTSGTTSAPKGCRLTHEALVRQWLVGGDLLDLRTGDRFWNPMPLFHLSGLGPLLFTVDAGATLICQEHFAVAEGLDQIERERATHLFPLFPPILLALLQDEAYRPSRMAHVRVVGHTASPETALKCDELLPDGAVQVGFYGMTECSGTLVTADRLVPLDRRLDVIGRPHEGIDVRIVDPETGWICTPETPGEIQVRGYCVFEGYHDAPGLTADAFVDGWFRTGDHGAQDTEGRLRFLGRLKEMLKVGGENVAPAEIEAHLQTHPAVRVAQVVGRPDEWYGEVPVAFVELIRPVTPDELVQYCVGQLASWKVPRAVRVVDEWPMSATKIQKFRLREWALRDRADDRDLHETG